MMEVVIMFAFSFVSSLVKENWKLISSSLKLFLCVNQFILFIIVWNVLHMANVAHYNDLSGKRKVLNAK